MQDFYHGRFESIQVLRGIAAVFVLFEHIRFLNCGAFGVDIFFCISGFMMMLSTHKGLDRYWQKRLTRVLPLYYLMTIFTFLCLLFIPSMFEVSTADPIQLVKSLCFIPFDIGGGVIQPLVRVGWTMNYEMFFYLIFYLSARLSNRYRGLICSIILVAVHLFVKVFSPGSIILSFYGDSVILEFALGILAFYICRWIYGKKDAGKIGKIAATVSLFLAVIFFVMLVLMKARIYRVGFYRVLWWGIPAWIVVVATFTAGLFFHSARVLVLVGNMSFSIYLLHYYPVMLLDRKVFDFSVVNVKSVVGVFVTVLICLGISFLSWHFFEQPVTGKCREWFQKK